MSEITNQRRGSEQMIARARHELTEAEDQCGDWFEELLDTGMGVRDAACAALLRMRPEDRTNEFVVWLSDNTLYLDDDKAVQVR